MSLPDSNNPRLIKPHSGNRKKVAVMDISMFSSVAYVKERLHEKTFYSPDGCWFWIGACNSLGYGTIYVNNKKCRPHRLSYFAYHGFDGQHLDVCHSCDNPYCINPDHLFLGTHKDNMIDMRHVKTRNLQSLKPKDMEAYLKEIERLESELEQCRLDLKEERNEVESSGKTISAQRKSNLATLLKVADSKVDDLQQQNQSYREDLKWCIDELWHFKNMDAIGPLESFKLSEIARRLSSGEKKPETT